MSIDESILSTSHEAALESVIPRLIDMDRLLAELGCLHGSACGESNLDALRANALQLLELADRQALAVPTTVRARVVLADEVWKAVAANDELEAGFREACRDLQRAVLFSLTQGAAARERVGRLQRLLAKAGELLGHADASGIAVDAQTRQEILEAQEAVAMGLPTLQHELQLEVAYAKLCKATKPVTADTIAASTSKSLREAWRTRNDGTPNNWGRHVHLVIFCFVLVATAVALGFQSVGESAIKRMTSLTTQYMAQQDQQVVLDELRRGKHAEYEMAVGSKAVAAAQLAASSAATAAETKSRLNLDATTATATERRATAKGLQLWSRGPCFIRGMCGPFDSTENGPPKDDALVPPMVFEAQVMIDRMNNVVLPMLLGLLGAYAYVLRAMTKEIRTQTFQSNALIHHVVRLSLGALAGIAVGWFLRPEQLGLDKNAPTWVLAFLAGYGADSLFELLDRLIGGIGAKPRDTSG